MKTVPSAQCPPNAETLRHRRERGLSTGYGIPGTELPLLLHRFFLSEASFNRCADARQHVFRWLSELTVGLELKIFLEGFGCPFGRDHLIPLERSFADQVHSLPVVSVGSGRIGGSHLFA